MEIAAGAARFLSSSRLALLVLAAIAALSAYGTIPGREKSAGVFVSPPFLALWALLILNILFCTVRRHRSRRAAWSSVRLAAVAAGDLAIHFSLLLIVAGMLVKGLFGTVGTQNVRVGERTDTMYDWSTQGDVPIGFGVLVRRRVSDYYPTRARIAVKVAATGEKVALVELTEGRPGAVPGTPLRLTIGPFDPEAGALTLAAGDGLALASLTLGTAAPEQAVRPFGKYTLALAAYQQELRGIAAEVSIQEGDRVVRTARLAVNERVSHRGTNLFLTAWGKDQDGKPFVGIQFTRDPGAPIFWAGGILLLAGLPLFLVARRWRSDLRRARR